MSTGISKEDVINFQNSWGNAVVKIGSLYSQKKDYEQETIELVNTFYGYNDDTVLFKPTLAEDTQFRLSTQSAISYFIGNNPNFAEDNGFALQPWIKVRFENSGFIFGENHAISMGNYFFTNTEGQEKKVEYTMGIYRNEKGELKMNLHHSSLPYQKPKL